MESRNAKKWTISNQAHAKAIAALEKRLPVAAILIGSYLIYASDAKLACLGLVVLYIVGNVAASKIIGKWYGHTSYPYYETAKLALSAAVVALSAIYVPGISKSFWLLHLVTVFRLPLVFHHFRAFISALLLLTSIALVAQLAIADNASSGLAPGVVVFCVGIVFQSIVTYLFRSISKVEDALETIEAQQAQLVNASKFSALGEMAGGIAHEINNPIGTIQLRADHIIRMLKTREGSSEVDATKIQQASEFAGIILETCKRIGTIVNGLKHFSRSGKADPFQPVFLSKIVYDTLNLCREKMNLANVDIHLSLDESLELNCREVEVSQVLLNLLTNAYFELQKLSGDRQISIQSQTSATHIIVSVTDNGRGIPEDKIEKIMEPFYTTKGIGEGTGLGLSISKGIMEAHGGELRVTSEPGNTSFQLSFPHKIESKIAA